MGSVQRQSSPVGSMEDCDEPDPVKHDMRWMGDDGANVFIEWQGSLLCVAYRKGPRLCKTDRKRGKCQPFSSSSRLRMFRLINRLDWSAAGRSTFFTATWPDQLGRPMYEQITDARTKFQASWERKAKKACPGLWRVEWKIRQSGRYQGQVMPHVHAIYFGCPFCPWEWWFATWKRGVR